LKFFKQTNKNPIKYYKVKVDENIFFKNYKTTYYIDANSAHSTSINSFSSFITNNGFLVKNKLLLGYVIKSLVQYIYLNQKNIQLSHPNIKWVVDDVIVKKLNYTYIFNLTINLIKPPFIVKSVLIPKKLRKKTKQKYLIKIVYKNNLKRLKSAYKQLHYYSNKFPDGKFKTRLYKSLIFSFLDWKQSYLFKLKTSVFKKFFKF
jgi:hypothetical protein